nr:MAG TPA: hypothetical protein [Caudoviricetes sp.]
MQRSRADLLFYLVKWEIQFIVFSTDTLDAHLAMRNSTNIVAKGASMSVTAKKKIMYKI